MPAPVAVSSIGMAHARSIWMYGTPPCSMSTPPAKPSGKLAITSDKTKVKLRLPDADINPMRMPSGIPSTTSMISMLIAAARLWIAKSLILSGLGPQALVSPHALLMFSQKVRELSVFSRLSRPDAVPSLMRLLASACFCMKDMMWYFFIVSRRCAHRICAFHLLCCSIARTIAEIPRPVLCAAVTPGMVWCASPMTLDPCLLAGLAILGSLSMLCLGGSRSLSVLRERERADSVSSSSFSESESSSPSHSLER
mmetsp:Transcript_17287/g.45750  ORF Transcript_17287/g.45750 Transcript_17287/m.45750 type:complete len:254 (+) Transcript_17287:301-1062(+)